MIDVLLVFVGGCVGAVTRYLTDRFVSLWHESAFPWGTFAVNIVGSFVLGAVAGASSSAAAAGALLVGTGFCGALTTFSTFSFETVRLTEDRRAGVAAAYVLVSLAVGLGAATAGFALS